MAEVRKPRRARVKRGIYRQPTASSRSAPAGPGRLHFRTAGDDLLTARRAHEDLIAALEAGGCRPPRIEPIADLGVALFANPVMQSLRT